MNEDDIKEIERALNNSNHLSNDYMVLVKRGAIERLYAFQQELQLKDKVIDLMAQRIFEDILGFHRVGRYYCNNADDIKQSFINKAKEEA